jgi:Na+-transporting NADH:ubiquinone oxidoreductase subunit C
LYQNVEVTIVDLDRGEYLTEEEIREVLNVTEVSDYNQALAANVPPISYTLGTAEDLAGIQRRENYSFVYRVKEGDEVKQLILPIRGYGLWSTLFGFVAIDAQSLGQGPENIKISGLKYYQHQETPGLGGEVDNPRWLAQWPGKRIYDANWNVKIDLSKNATTEYQVDALSGATITGNGVEYMMQFWFGPLGFRPFLQNQSQP